MKGPGDFDRKPMIARDLQALPEHPTIIAKGAHVTPDIARPSSRALRLMPSAEEQRTRLIRRHPVASVLADAVTAGSLAERRELCAKRTGVL